VPKRGRKKARKMGENGAEKRGGEPSSGHVLMEWIAVGGPVGRGGDVRRKKGKGLSQKGKNIRRFIWPAPTCVRRLFPLGRNRRLRARSKAVDAI